MPKSAAAHTVAAGNPARSDARYLVPFPYSLPGEWAGQVARRMVLPPNTVNLQKITSCCLWEECTFLAQYMRMKPCIFPVCTISFWDAFHSSSYVSPFSNSSLHADSPTSGNMHLFSTDCRIIHPHQGTCTYPVLTAGCPTAMHGVCSPSTVEIPLLACI